MKKFVSAIGTLIALCTLTACNDADIRERRFVEVACFGFLEKDNDKYKCASDSGTEEVDPFKIEKSRTVTINRRTSSVAFDKQIVGDCRVVDFDSWECVERVPVRGALGHYDSIQYRRSLGDGYLEEWCAVQPDAPAARTQQNCKGDQRYYGISVSDVSRFRDYLRNQFCSTPHKFCSWL